MFSATQSYSPKFSLILSSINVKGESKSATSSIPVTAPNMFLSSTAFTISIVVSSLLNISACVAKELAELIISLVAVGKVALAIAPSAA